jgi:hypothetical protein
MLRPANIDRPFFAYGIFKPSQLGFLQLKQLVSTVSMPCSVAGTLRIRDGLPILSLEGTGNVTGVILFFKERLNADAYDRIAALEPEKQYRWEELKSGDTTVNVLVGKSPNRGSVACEDREWDGRKDPLFTVALEVIEEILQQNRDFDWSLKPSFRLQMAYLLLWSAIERYVSLRYHLRENAVRKVNELADEPNFCAALKAHVKTPRHVYSASGPEEKVGLDPNKPLAALKYYYQVRSNITHRGKAATMDHNVVCASLDELVRIFHDVLDGAFFESKWVTDDSEFPPVHTTV